MLKGGSGLKKSTNLIIAVLATILFIGIILYLGFEFRAIDKEGVACMHNPMGYAGTKIYEVAGDTVTCECTKERKCYDLEGIFSNN